MPFPTDEKYILQAESKLGVKLPAVYRLKLVQENGGELETPPDAWHLYPVLDSSDRKRLKRTCNDIVLETTNAKKWTGFPIDAVAIGHNGGGDKLILLPSSTDPTKLGSALYWWDHETGAINLIVKDLTSVFRS